MNARMNTQPTPAPRRRGPMARLLRAVAGTTGAYRATRRGSFLVLVVGTLALMSVFAVVYIAIGRADTGAATGVKRNAERDNVPEQFADYVCDVLSNSVFSLARVDDQPADVTPPTELKDLRIRKAWTSPGVDPKVTVKEFDPAGTSTDPFLSSTMPTSLALNNADDEYIQYKDWLNLSALAPSGVPVNLYNLRGNFDATPDDLRQGLTLLDANGKPTNQTAFNTALPSGGKFEDLEPWYYWTLQRGLNQPATNTAGNRDTADYLPYQYASASGSGMYDSRWFEMTRQKFDGAGQPQGFESLIDGPAKYRYFFSAKVIDLSSLVNVSTAGDFFGQATAEHPAGFTPADIDVRRLFTLEDFAHQVSGSNGKWKATFLQSGTYADFVQPAMVDPGASPKDPANYEKYDDSNGARAIGENAYNALRVALTQGFVPGGNKQFTGSSPFAFADAEKRADFFTDYGAFDRSVVNDGSVYSVGALFSAEDVLDLFAFRGWNNPTIDSTLERIVGGRYAGASVNATGFSVLRDNRPFAVERDAIDIDDDQQADDRAMFAMFANARQYLTTISGSRPLRSTYFNLNNTVQKAMADQLSNAEVKVSADAGPVKTFPVYAQSLIPMSGLSQTWSGGASPSEFGQFRTMNYGAFSAEVGLQVAANMAVNLDRMIKWDTKPRAFTVLVHDDFRDDLEQDRAAGTGGANAKGKDIKSRKYKQSWWVESTANTGKLDYGNEDTTISNLAHSGTKTSAAAFNVFGVGPEPVLTSVATMILYTDAPYANGDSGAQEECNGDAAGGNSSPININGSIDATNPDCIVQIVAFQLTNPYDVSINLTPTVAKNDNTSAPYDYYIEFGERQFRIGKVNADDPTLAIEPVSLAPGATRVFYATNTSLRAASKRLQNVMRLQGSAAYLPNWDNADYAFAQFQKLIKSQLAVDAGSLSGGGANYDPVWIEPFTDNLIPSNSPPSAYTNIKKGLRNAYTDRFIDLLGAADKTTELGKISMKTVRLWRALRSTDSAIVTSTGEEPRQPTDPLPEQFLENDMLVDRIRDGTNNNSFPPALDCRLAKGDQDVSGTEGYKENDPDDPGDNTGFSLFKYGMIRRPADPDSGSLAVGAVPAYMLEARFSNGNFNTLSPDFKTSIGNSLNKQFFQDRGPDVISGDNQSAGITMSLLINRAVISFNRPSVLPYRAFLDRPSDWNDPKLNAAGMTWRAPYQNHRPLLPAKLPADQIRAGDVLLPLAVGPMQFIFDQSLNESGLPDPNSATYNYTDATWITASEMLSLVTGQDRVLKSTAAPDNYFATLYRGIGPSGGAVLAGASPAYLFDKAQVALDRFVPFYDKNRNGSPVDPSGKPEAGEYRIGLGIPAALAAIDGFIAPELAHYGSVSKSIPGQVNIVTAPLPVLRTLPMLSPSTESGAWWWKQSLPDLGATVLNANCDVAATVAGYRDKVLTRYRADSPRSGPIGQAFNADFRDSANIKPNDPATLDGRYVSSGVEGVREGPGLRSLGELMMARYSDPNNSPPTPPDRASIDNLARYASTGKNSTGNHGLGIDSVTYKDSSGKDIPTDAQGTLGQQLAIANGVFNTATTRSDLFGVWFVVQGYQRSDVEGLGPDVPMVPSVQRRFFMVIDRSEVVKKGQKPRIVLMKELPM